MQECILVPGTASHLSTALGTLQRDNPLHIPFPPVTHTQPPHIQLKPPPLKFCARCARARAQTMPADGDVASGDIVVVAEAVAFGEALLVKAESVENSLGGSLGVKGDGFGDAGLLREGAADGAEATTGDDSLSEKMQKPGAAE